MRGGSKVRPSRLALSFAVLNLLAIRRGTGEEGVLRTNGSASDGKSIQSKATPTAKKGYPRVIATTPGKEVLQRVLLGRVFGMRV